MCAQCAEHKTTCELRNHTLAHAHTSAGTWRDTVWQGKDVLQCFSFLYSLFYNNRAEWEAKHHDDIRCKNRAGLNTLVCLYFGTSCWSQEWFLLIFSNTVHSVITGLRERGLFLFLKTYRGVSLSLSTLWTH